MKYFIMKTHQDYIHAPQPKAWFGKIDTRDFVPERFQHVPNKTLFFVHSNPNLVFIDMLSSPFFMVTKPVRKVLELYNPHLPSKQIVLLDRDSGLSEVYYIPLFKRISCLHADTQLNVGKTHIEKVVLNRIAIKDTPVFRIEDISEPYIVARMDVVESILKREPRGIELIETDMR